MKATVKLVVAALILHATVRVGWASWNYYQLKDAAQQAVTFGGQAPPEDIRVRILDVAAELELPVRPTDVRVTRAGFRTRADASYTQAVEVVPTYRYPVEFSFSVDAVSLTGLR